MSEEETKVEAAAEAAATDDSTTEEAAPKKKGIRSRSAISSSWSRLAASRRTSSA